MDVLILGIRNERATSELIRRKVREFNDSAEFRQTKIVKDSFNDSDLVSTTKDNLQFCIAREEKKEILLKGFFGTLNRYFTQSGAIQIKLLISVVDAKFEFNNILIYVLNRSCSTYVEDNTNPNIQCL